MALLGSVVWLGGEWTWLHLMQSLEEWDSYSPKVSGGSWLCNAVASVYCGDMKKCPFTSDGVAITDQRDDNGQVYLGELIEVVYRMMRGYLDHN